MKTKIKPIFDKNLKTWNIPNMKAHEATCRAYYNKYKSTAVKEW